MYISFNLISLIIFIAILALCLGIFFYYFQKRLKTKDNELKEARERISFFETVLNEGIGLTSDIALHMSSIKLNTERSAMDVISALQNIIKNSKEGSEEAKAVVHYFMGQKNGEDECFGESYISKIIKENESSMNQISDVFHSIREMNLNFISELKSLVSEIVKICEFADEIKDIATSSKILGLNASIEAAKAGSYGKSFSVIANDIGKLAEQSKLAAVHVDKMMKNFSQLFKSLLSDMNKHILNKVSSIEAAEQNMKNTFNGFKKSIANISEAIEVVTLNYQNITGSIENAVVSLQFQDITGQKISYVINMAENFKQQLNKMFNLDINAREPKPEIFSASMGNTELKEEEKPNASPFQSYEKPNENNEMAENSPKPLDDDVTFF